MRTVRPASLRVSFPNIGSVFRATDDAASTKDGAIVSPARKIIGTKRGVPVSSVDTLTKPIRAALRTAVIGQRTSEGAGTTSELLKSGGPLELARSLSNSPTAAMTAGP